MKSATWAPVVRRSPKVTAVTVADLAPVVVRTSVDHHTIGAAFLRSARRGSCGGALALNRPLGRVAG